jgi:hypothetical protein
MADPNALHHIRELLLSRGLAVLAAWAVLNLLLSGYLAARTDRRRAAHHFHVMNAAWGFVNAALATWGIVHLRLHAPAGLSVAGFFTRQLSLETTFLLNAGLDVAYVAAGFWLHARAAVPGTSHSARLLGYGQSLWVQGGFLLVFDVVMWALMRWAAQPLLIGA